MKKIAIVTLSDFNNYGNRLQNYALERIITSQGYDVVSLVDFRPNLLKTSVKTIIKKDGIKFTDRMKKIRRLKNFLDFDKKYVNTFPVNAGEFSSVSDDEYHCFIVGSDQVWNPDWAKYTYDKMFLRFCSPTKRISYAASFGVDKIPEELEFLLRMYCRGSIAMTVEWATTGMKMSPEQLADQLIDAMPPKLYDLFKDI